jgi:NAD(P)-dependent dehydrogenase (short-subunit alcohol dehydrogenase family)
MTELKGKIALITGASKGLGLETARQLGQLGATVVISGRNLTKVVAAAEALRGTGIAAEAVQLDVTDASQRAGVYEYLARRHGSLDILVNNAAVWLESPSASVQPPNQTSFLPDAVLRATLEANFFAPVQLTQLLLPLVRAAPSGRIVNISSVLGSLKLQADSDSAIYMNKIFAYDTSKAALNSFTIHLAHELRETKIKVNSVHPGWVRSDMGGAAADLDVVAGSRTSVQLATIPDDGPTGGFFFMEETVPW